MRAGARDQLVQLQVKTSQIVASGGIEDTWLDLGPMEWAQVVQQVPGINSEQLYSGQLRATATYKVIIPFYDGLSPAAHRVMWLGNVLDIHAVDSTQNGGRRETVLVCQQGLTNG